MCISLRRIFFYREVDSRLLTCVEKHVRRQNAIAEKIGVTFGPSKTEILVPEADLALVEDLFRRSVYVELREARKDSKVRWLGFHFQIIGMRIRPEKVSTTLGRLSSE